MKTCACCRQHLPRERFNRCNSRGSDGWQAYCRDCQHAHNHHYHRAGLRDPRPDKAYQHRFNCNREFLVERLERQGGVCAICGSDQPKGRWTLDHDHGCCPDRVTCGQCIRGVLCIPCNFALGKVEKAMDPRREASWREEAERYLEHAR